MAFPSGTSFVFVGKLSAMSREQARALVEARGGVCPSAVSDDLDYLVVGNENSPFAGGEKKPKQMKAEALVEAGAPIAIIDEQEFLGLLEEVLPGEPEVLAEPTAPGDLEKEAV